MRIAAQVATAMQAVFGASVDDLARTTRCVQRQRKFSGTSLARTLVLAVLLRPAAKNRDFQAMAAKLGVHVTDEAIDRRFTNELVMFLEEILKQAVAQTLAAKAAATPLLQKFSDVRIDDSTSLMLPDEFADRFPGCGGTENACLAAIIGFRGCSTARKSSTQREKTLICSLFCGNEAKAAWWTRRLCWASKTGLPAA